MVEGLEVFFQEYGAQGFTPISVVVQNGAGAPAGPEDAETWATELGLTFPVLADPVGEFYATWDPDEVLPVAYIIDEKGVVLWGEAGGAGGLEEMEDQIKDALGIE